MSRRGRSEEEEKNEEKMMLRDAGSTSNRDPARGGRSVGLVTGGDGGQSKPGICDDGSSDPPMIRCHPGGIWYGTVRYGNIYYGTSTNPYNCDSIYQGYNIIA